MHDTEANPSPVKEGDILAGKYRVERVLGVGGMGVVVAAVHVQLGQHVALKFLHGPASREPNAVARFLREARAVVQIQSEHVARVSDVGTLENGAPYIVMEFLNGQDLDKTLATRGTLPIEEAIDYVAQACEAIAEAHKANIVHRDLKPANLFVTRRADGTPLVKVLDFGISKLEGDTLAGSGGLTSTSALFGSPLYMSPEQMRSAKKVDARTDIWALGIILHELLTGARAFDADTLPGLCTAIATEPPTRLREKLPSAPPGLEAAILRCLEKDPSARFQNVADFVDALIPFAPRSVQSAERIRRVLGVAPNRFVSSAPPSGANPTSAASTGNGLTSTDRGWGSSNTNATERRSSPALIVAGFAALLVAAAGIGVGAMLFARSRSAKSDAAVEAVSAPPGSVTSVASASATVLTTPPPSIAPAAVAPVPAPAAVDAGAPPPSTSAEARPASKPEAARPTRPSTQKPTPPAGPAAAAPPPSPPPQGATPRDGYSDRK